MATAKKPGDETLPRAPAGLTRRDAYVEASDDDESSVITGLSKRAASKAVAAAPEASQGAWRERAFTPRGVMSKDEVGKALEATLRTVLSTADHCRVAFEEVRAGWLPFLRQAVEQAGGDGIDAFLLSALKPPGRAALDPLMGDLVAGVERLRRAPDLAHLEEDALKLIERVRQVMSAQRPRRLSFKQLERELEGKLEVDELLSVAFCDEGELKGRESELASTMEQLKDQLRSRPGHQPGGMYANFVRLKAELRIVDAERKRRAGLSGHGSEESE